MNEHHMRDAYDAALRATHATAAEPAVPLDRLEALITRTGDEAERLRTLDLLTSSAEGRLALDVAWAAKRAADTTRPSRWARTWSAAAAVLVLSVGTVRVLQGRREVTDGTRASAVERAPSVPSPSLRQPSGDDESARRAPAASDALARQAPRAFVRAPDEDVMRGDESPLVLIAPRGTRVLAHARIFAWHAVAGARDYSMVLVDSAGTEVFTATTRDTTLTLPDSVRLRAGAEYLWWVQTDRGDGTTISAVTERVRLRND